MHSFNERYRSVLELNASRLCVGLDTDPRALPASLSGVDDPVAEFNTRIIEATKDLCCAYKLNLAFYESAGIDGLRSLERTLERVPEEMLVIGDAKRGDIGNTAERYADSLLRGFEFDAVTVNPYLGIDSLEPFFRYEGRCVFVLALTSNPGSKDFQHLVADGKTVYMHVIDRCMEAYGATGSLGFVVGATHPDELAAVRRHVGPDIPLLVPGLGTQGGDAEATVRANDGGIAFFNVSRGIAGAGKGDDFAARARDAARAFVGQLSERAHSEPA